MLHWAAKSVISKTINVYDESYPRELFGASLLFVSMPHTRDHLFAITMAKSIGIPVVCDIDDLMTYTNFPNYHREHEDCLEIADKVICATEELYNYWSKKLGDKTIIIKNFLDLNLSAKTKSLRTSIVVRGSTARKADYEHFIDIFNEIEERLHPKWFFMGIKPESFSPRFSEKISWTEPMVYFMRLCNISPHFIFHPIMFTPENVCKSLSAYHEAALCQAQLVTTADWWKEKNILYKPEDMSLPVKPAVKNVKLIHESINQYKTLLNDFIN
jgi:hypothetical protein